MLVILEAHTNPAKAIAATVRFMRTTNRPSASVDRERTKGAKHAAVAILRPQPHAASFALVKEFAGVHHRHLFAFREAAKRTGDDGVECDIIHGTCAAALRLEPRRQIRQPLRRGINERSLCAFVETGHYQCPDDDEEQTESGPRRLADR
jgi:hypothetical protein